MMGMEEKPGARSRAYSYHLQFVASDRSGAGLFLEAHWRLTDRVALSDCLPAEDLWKHSAILWGMGLTMFVLAMLRFRKRL